MGKGDEEQTYLGILVLVAEGIPQFLITAMGQIHWHGDFNIKALTFFISFIDIPLTVWYLSFYCNERTKYAVISKIINLAVMNCGGEWVALVETYIYDEKEDIEMDPDWSEERNDHVVMDDIASPWKMVCYQMAYILASPIIGKMAAMFLLNCLSPDLFMPRCRRIIFCSQSINDPRFPEENPLKTQPPRKH